METSLPLSLCLPLNGWGSDRPYLESDYEGEVRKGRREGNRKLSEENMKANIFPSVVCPLM